MSLIIQSEAYDGRYMKLTCTQTRDVVNNKSTINWILTSTGGDDNYYSTGPTTVTINGEQVYYKARVKYTAQTFPAAKGSVSGSIDVPHNTDGTKSIEVSLATRIYYGGAAKTHKENWTLEAMDYLGDLECSTNDFSGELQCQTPEGIAGYFNLYVNNTLIGEQISLTNTIDLNSYAESIYEVLPTELEGNLMLKLVVTNNSKTIATLEKTITLSVPNNVIPTVGLTSAIDQELGYLLQGKSQINLGFDATSPGSPIRSYTITIKKGSQNLKTLETTNNNITLGPFSQTGQLTFLVTAKDARGRASSEVSSSFTCYAYTPPSFSSFQVYRTNNNGVEASDGQYIKSVYEVSFTSIKINNVEQNDVVVKLYVDNIDNGEYTSNEVVGLNSSTSTHQVYLTIEDNFYKGQSTPIKTILTAERILNVAPGGTGIAIGKKASSNGGFECAWDAKFNGDVTIDGNLTFTGSGLFDMIYPIGSIYMSVNSTSPATLFGGTWTQIQNRFLLAAGSDYTAGNTGGSVTTTLTTNNLPAHNHGATSTYSGASFDVRAGSNPTGKDENVNDRQFIKAGENTSVELGGSNTKWDNAFSWSTNDAARNLDRVSINGTVTTTIGSTGSGTPINTMPPYLAVYMWKRIS